VSDAHGVTQTTVIAVWKSCLASREPAHSRQPEGRGTLCP
jgi:hypothetical protein